MENLKKELKEYVDAKIEGISNRIDGVEKSIRLLAGFMMATFVSIVLTLIAIVFRL